MAEQDIDKTIRGILYLFGLFYMFAGVNIVADQFMNAVEVICDTKKRVFKKDLNRKVTVTVWNATVANLTLLALGSSAPEILLSVIETVGNEFYAGELGPSTIVGSAAFNLLVIIATCVLAIPEGESRRIQEMAVYHVTVVFSFFAYMWLLTMCSIISPDIVEIWEACLTLAMMPTLVTVSYFADRGKLNFMALDPKTLPWRLGSATAVETNNERPPLGSGSRRESQLHHPRLEKARASRASVKSITGSRQSIADNALASDPQRGGAPGTNGDTGTAELPAGDNGQYILDTDGKPINQPQGVFTFPKDAFEVPTGAEEKMVPVRVLRRNGTEGTVSCKYHTEAFCSVAEFDFVEASGELIFEDGETWKEIEIQIKPKEAYERNRDMQLVLDEPEGGAVFNPNDDGGEDACILTITLVNERKAGGCMSIIDMMFNVKKIRWGLELWKDQIKGAFVLGGDDEEEDGEEHKLGPVDYVDYVLTMPFRVIFGILCPPAPWAGGWMLFGTALGLIAVVTATICDLAELFGCCMELDNEVTAITIVALGTSLPDMFASQVSARKDPFADASIVNVTGSNSVNVFLGIGIPWTFCAFYWQGTGTTTEWELKYPDIYKDWPDGVYAVPAGTLGFSVMVFNAVAIIALTLLRCRRLVLGGELGGPKNMKVISFIILISCWSLYVGLSITRSKSKDVDFFKFILVGLAFIVFCGGIFIDLMVRQNKIKTYQSTVSEEEEALKPKDGVPSLPVVALNGAPVEAGESPYGEKNPPDVVGKMQEDNVKEYDENGYPLDKKKLKKKLSMKAQASMDMHQEIVVGPEKAAAIDTNAVPPDSPPAESVKSNEDSRPPSPASFSGNSRRNSTRKKPPPKVENGTVAASKESRKSERSNSGVKAKKKPPPPDEPGK